MRLVRVVIHSLVHPVPMSVRRADSGHPPPRVSQLPERMPDLGGASCTDHPYVPPSAWTGASHRDQALAKAVCGTCVVLRQCRKWALGPSAISMSGILGGLSAAERRQARHDREVAR